MRRLDGHLLVALDGTEFFRSRNIHCDNCSTRRRGDGGTEYFHQMVAATVVAPGRAQSLPLPPEFVAPQDGAAKQDCERQAVKRWLRSHGDRCAALRPVYLGDDLYACQPVCRAMLDAGGDFLLTAKPASHKTLYEYLDGIDIPVRRRTTGRGAQRRTHRYRWMTDLPIRDGDDALRVNWLEVTSARPGGKVTYRGTFVTSLPVDRDNVAELADCARARWKIENETFNVLKQHGYHLEHNFGHGKDTLAAVLVVLNLLAFALHTACEVAESTWRRARERLGTRARLFEHLRTVTEYQGVPRLERADRPARHGRARRPASLTHRPRRQPPNPRTSDSPETQCLNRQNENCWTVRGTFAPSSEGGRGWAVGGAVAERQRGREPAMGRYDGIVSVPWRRP